MKIEIQIEINRRAKEKNDGVYTYHGIIYRVKNNRATHYVEWGNVLMNYGNFNVDLGNLKDHYSDTARKHLKQIRD